MNFSSFSLCIVFLFSTLFAQASIIPHYNKEATLEYELVPFCKNKLCGYVDRQGNVKIKADYEGLSFFNKSGFAQFKKYGLYGVIDKSGKEVVTAFSTKPLAPVVNLENLVEDTIANAFLAINMKAQEWIYFKEGTTPHVSSAYHVADEKHQYKVSDVHYMKWSSPNFYEGIRRAVYKDGSCNFINLDGNTILKNNIPYGAPSKNAIYVIDENDKIGAIDLKGNTIIPNRYSYVQHQDKFGYTVVTGTNSKKGVLDKNYEFIIDTSLTYIEVVSQNRFIISRDRTTRELVDKSLNPIFSKSYSQIRRYLNNLYTVKIDNQHYVLNEKEETLAGPFANTILRQSFGDDSKYLYTQGENPTTIIDNSGKTILTAEKNYSVRLGVIDSHYLLTTMHTGNLLIDNTGKVLIGPAIESIHVTDFEDCYLVKNNNQMGLYSASKEWVIPLGNYKISSFSKSGSPLRMISVTTPETITEYAGSLDNKTLKPNKYSNWGAEKRNKKEFVEVNFADGRQAIFPKDKQSTIEYTSKHAYMIKRFDAKTVQVYDEYMNPILPEGFTLWRDEKIKSDVFFIATNAQRESALADFEGNWIFPAKAQQNINLIEKSYWAVGTREEKHLYNTNFEQLTSKSYAGFKKANAGLIVAYNADKSIDILDANGQLLSEGEYTNLIGNHDNYLILEKSKDNVIRSCQVDGAGKEITCYPYADFFIPENTNYIIAKDLHDFGVVDKEGKEKIPFKYKTISYLEEINTYMCKKEDYSTDLYDSNFKPIGPGYKSLYKIEKVGEDYYFIKGIDKTAIFNANGEYLGTTDNKIHGTVAIRKANYHKQGLVWLYNRDMGSCFFDAHNKKALVPNH